jgi:hypothetical protein
MGKCNGSLRSAKDYGLLRLVGQKWTDVFQARSNYGQGRCSIIAHLSSLYIVEYSIMRGTSMDHLKSDNRKGTDDCQECNIVISWQRQIKASGFLSGLTSACDTAWEIISGTTCPEDTN